MPEITLKAARINAGLTQKELGKTLGISNTTVNSWENGDTEPTLTQLREISRLSGIPMDFICVRR